MNLPALYFRIRENGASVFRVDAENRHGRLDLEPLAFANVRNGEIRPQGGRELTPEERKQVETWIAARQDTLADEEARGIAGTVEAINAAAHWAQTKATDKEIAEFAGDVLLAMHDLRSVLVRRQSQADDSD